MNRRPRYNLLRATRSRTPYPRSRFLHAEPRSPLSQIPPNYYSSNYLQQGPKGSAIHMYNEPKPDREPKREVPHEMSDQEWDIRTGRAIYILQQTLPEFFESGLVAAVDPSKGPAINDGSVLRGAKVHGSGDLEQIYSPKVKLSYTPPAPLPAPFPRTLHIEGLPLYMASSVFVRHTLKALYTDLDVELRKVTVQSSSSRSDNAMPGFGQAPGNPEDIQSKDTLHRRGKSLFIKFGVLGNARVSGARGEWDVASTYTFSPTTGLISHHTINSIHPAPHLSAYDMLRAGLAKLGFGPGNINAPRPGGAGAACGEGGPRASVLRNHEGEGSRCR